jgi:hypothetical protein
MRVPGELRRHERSGYVGFSRVRMFVGRLRVAAIAVAFAFLGATCVAVAAGGQTAVVWGGAREVSLPVGANTKVNTQDADLNAVSCTSVGDCVAVGVYSDRGRIDHYQAMVAMETRGVWTRAAKLAALPGNLYGGGLSVACTRPRECVAVGTYAGQMVASEANGVWKRTTTVALPLGSSASADAVSSFDGVTCTGPGNCVAVGSYADNNGTMDYQAMVATEKNGGWGRAIGAMLPRDATTARDGQDAGFNSVACTSLGNCVAVGAYANTDTGDGSTEAMVATETNRVWAERVSWRSPPAQGSAPKPLISTRCHARSVEAAWRSATSIATPEGRRWLQPSPAALGARPRRSRFQPARRPAWAH